MLFRRCQNDGVNYKTRLGMLLLPQRPKHIQHDTRAESTICVDESLPFIKYIITAVMDIVRRPI